MPKPPTIEQSYYYGVPPSEVFSALTEPKGLSRWFLQEASIELRKGGPFRFTWRGGYTMKSRLRAVNAPKMVEFAWADRVSRGKVFKTVARFELKKRGAGTVLHLTHRGFKSGRRWIALYGAINSGWAYYLTNLRSVLEHAVDLRSDLDAVA